MTDRTDVLIIGGGVAGLTAAAELALHASVTLVESEDALAYHASGRSAAMFITAYGNATIRALNEASATHHMTDEGGVLTRRPIMLVGGADEEETLERERRGFDMRRITTDEAQALFPLLDAATAPFAALREDCHDLDTDLLIQNARRKALANGARLLTRAPVTRIARSDGWHVEAGEHRITAGTLVNAGGAWADAVAEMAGVAPIGLTPYRRSMARVPLAPGLDPAPWPFVVSINEAWYAKPDAGQLIVSPSEEHESVAMDAWADDMVIAEGLARFEAMTVMEVTRVTATWAGLRTFAPDRALVIGRDPAQPDFVWLAGQGGYGFQTAPAAARLCAALVTGAAPDLPSGVVAALSPTRFAT
ncbi:oxidoreductase, FAD-binding [Pseudooceanicola batsensis HTCC2597]|uniref:Oxidoreductase, FAD-binding n=1 Tax=Pseudooceanicola batsensis (strain ATCC BAA-863 / DSM 15984 / KCTC 12145 / HTCC2597) TaxID=252305 RepID=A3TV07_PSEBH|nr:FAD-binding oxidoreductase [Pseudooceanicola batsensis]EAQ04353.1 oxidoreductase, FAD-binding [Pseudooceanicola batsensis HTCC2597]